MKKIFAIILSLLMVMPLCMAVSAAEEVIPVESSWEISATSQMGTSIEKAFDGDLATNWHSNYKAEGSTILSKDEAPYVITVKFGKDTEVSGWRYHPRKDNEAGTVLAYNIYASKDGESYTKIFTGGFDYATKSKADFTPSVASWGAYTMKAIKIEITNGRGGYGTAAEIEFLKGTDGEAVKDGESFKDGDNKENENILKNDGTWKISASSAFGEGNAAAKAFDGAKTTYWHTNYKAEGGVVVSKDECPHTLTVDFGKTVEIAGWRYLMRHDNDTGTILTYNLYASNDGVNFTKIHTGKFDRTPGAVKEQTVYEDFFAKTSMKVMKIEVTSSVGGYGTAAEIEFYADGVASSGATGALAGSGDVVFSGTKIPASDSWKYSVTSVYGEGNAVAKAFDGNVKTYWHSSYKAEEGKIVSKDEPPYKIRVEFPEAMDISGWIYTPRTDNATGTITGYSIYASEDGVNFERIYIGTFTNFVSDASKNKPESATWGNKKMKAIEIEVTGGISNFGSAAEIEFLTGGTVAKEDAAFEGEAKNGIPYLSRKNWDVRVNSTMGNQTIQLALDGNVKTYWHSKYEAKDGAVLSHDNPPYFVDIDFGTEQTISGVNLVPRQDSINGNFIIVNVYAAEKADSEWVLLKEKVSFENSTGDKELFFLSNIKATKIRIEAVGTHAGYGTMAEIYVLSENPEFETVSYGDFAAREEAGTLYPIDAKSFTAEYMGACWDTHTADKIFDGSPKTFWQTEELKTGEEAILLVDLGKVTAVKEIVYTPRQTDDFHGCWLSVNIFASADNEEWIPLFEDFKMEKSTASVKFTLPEEIDARYFEFTITDYFAKRVSASELSFYQLGGHDDSLEQYVLTVGSNEIKYENADGEGTKTIDVAPYIVNGTTLIPLRGLLELMGAEISWNGDNQIIGVAGKDIDITLQIGYKLVFVEDPTYGQVRYTLRTVPVIKDSRTFIPVRFVSEQLGYTVSWNGETGEITITK